MFSNHDVLQENLVLSGMSKALDVDSVYDQGKIYNLK